MTTSNIPANSDSPWWMKRVPMITGILAALAGFLTVRGANLSNQAIYNSNQGVLYQAKASDKWAEYEADSIKQHIVKTALETGVPEASNRAKLQAEEDDFQQRKPGVMQQAQDFEKQRDAELNDGQRRLSQKDLLDYAGVAAQLGIALASVAALTRRYPAFAAGLVAGALGLLITAYGILAPYFHR